MNRVYSVPNVSVSGGMGDTIPAWGGVVNSKKDIRDAQRRIYNETGREVVEWAMRRSLQSRNFPITTSRAVSLTTL